MRGAEEEEGHAEVTTEARTVEVEVGIISSIFTDQASTLPTKEVLAINMFVKRLVVNGAVWVSNTEQNQNMFYVNAFS